jgi:hypothetical protein
MDEYNKLKAEEMKKKAYNAFNNTQTYKNEWSNILKLLISTIYNHYKLILASFHTFLFRPH